MEASRVDGSAASVLTETVTSLASHATSTTPDAAAGDQSTAGMLGGLLLGVFTIIPSLLYWLISFITITIPTWIFSFLSRIFTLTLNMTTLLLLLPYSTIVFPNVNLQLVVPRHGLVRIF